MPNVNPEILRWARETAGLSLVEAADELGLRTARGKAPAERLAALEEGSVAPTRPQLLKMSKRYRRPLLTFYLPAPPQVGSRGKDFRTLPEGTPATDQALVDAVIRDIRARQTLVKQVLIDEKELEPLPFIGSANMKGGPARVASDIEHTLGFGRETFRSCRGAGDAFAYLRERVEAAGVFVLLVDNLGSPHTTISAELFRGFALADEIAPFVAVNANDAKGAWSFTLVHELAHLWLGATGISGQSVERKIERFCNDVASEFLVPAAELAGLVIDPEAEPARRKAAITAFARDRNVSSTMIAYKLYTAGRIAFGDFELLRNAYRQDYLERKEAQRERGRESNGGPSYYVVRRQRLGTALVSLVDRMVNAGALTTTKAGKVLGVKPRNVQGVIDAGRPTPTPLGA